MTSPDLSRAAALCEERARYADSFDANCALRDAAQAIRALRPEGDAPLDGVAFAIARQLSGRECEAFTVKFGAGGGRRDCPQFKEPRDWCLTCRARHFIEGVPAPAPAEKAEQE